MKLYPAITGEIEDSPRGPGTIAFFDLDGTLIHGFSIVSMFWERALSGKVAPVEAVGQLFSLGHRHRHPDTRQSERGQRAG